MGKGSKGKGETPLMKQFNQIKSRYPDALLLFRVGDFYETFGGDAVKASKILDIVLTQRSNGAAADLELAGFPHHALDTYLPKLVRAGERVAICDQLEDPKLTKGIVKRGVTELVTPGVSYHDKTLNSKQNNYLASFSKNGNTIGLSFLDISTGEFLVAEGDNLSAEKLISSFNPAEIIVCKKDFAAFQDAIGESLYTNKIDDWVSSSDYVKESLLEHFETLNLKGFGIEDLELGKQAAAMILYYLKETEHKHIDHIKSIQRITADEYVWLDKFTIRNLELFNPSSAGGVALIDVLDQTQLPMGARLLRRWLAFPLKDIESIQERHEIVEELVQNQGQKNEIARLFKSIGDLDRLVAKVSTLKIQPRELGSLKSSLGVLPELKALSKNIKSRSLNGLLNQLDPLEALCKRLETELKEDAPVNILKGGAINSGVSDELDELRSISTEGKTYLDNLLKREIERTGIASLKIAHNNVFGYYLEVRNTYKDKVPEEWIRKQTLVNAERYITEELKEYEQKILGAEERISALEQELFGKLVQSVAKEGRKIQDNAYYLAKLDCLMSFATIAQKNNYNKPALNEETALVIKDGRHPVIELQLDPGQSYIANDLLLDQDEQQIIILTGPNMAGKSALLRQTALICIMAQIGSYVPAASADIGLIDKVFTRVGASDNISQGESTFMVEMNETASILNNVSARSLVLLDEIGRGTSTYDGISIAWAISEFLHEHPAKAKTLFATHYHELTDLSDQFARVKNFNVSVKEHKNKVIFQRKLVEGGSHHSFGIHVAQMAGMPEWVVAKSRILLKELEKKSEFRKKEKAGSGDQEMQLNIFKVDDPVLERIRDEIEVLDINVLTPVEALMKLNEIKKLVGG